MVQTLVDVAAFCGVIVLLVFTASLLLTFIGACLMFIGKLLGGDR